MREAQCGDPRIVDLGAAYASTEHRTQYGREAVVLRFFQRRTFAEIGAALRLSEASIAVAAALDRLSAREGHIALPGYTHMQQAMPSSVAR